MKFLFICSKNNGQHHIRSAGTSSTARIKLTQQDINWADLIFVMEDKHKDFILDHFEIDSIKKKIQVLGIEDKYKFNDPELIDLLKSSVENYLH